MMDSGIIEIEREGEKEQQQQEKRRRDGLYPAGTYIVNESGSWAKVDGYNKKVRVPSCFIDEGHNDYGHAMKTWEGLAYRALCRMHGKRGTFVQVLDALKSDGLQPPEATVLDNLEKMEKAGWISKA